MRNRRVASFRVTARLALRTLLLTGVIGMASMQASAQTKRIYTVRAGDTLYRIAVNHSMTVEQLQQLNGIEGTVIKVGQVLRLTGAPLDVASDSTVVAPVGSLMVDPEPETPASEPEAPAVEVTPEPEPDLGPRRVRAMVDSSGAVVYGTYVPRPGETFFGLAYAFGVSPDTLVTMNPGHLAVLDDRGEIKVPARLANTSYTVKAGDTLFKIASAEGVSIGDLRAANPDTGDLIRVGQQLVIPSGAVPAEPTLPPVITQGKASVYPARFAGRLMASGQSYDAAKFTLSHPTLPFGTVVTVENADSGVATFAEVTDRMPVSTEFVVEVSKAVADAISLTEGGVRVRIIDTGAGQ